MLIVPADYGGFAPETGHKRENASRISPAGA